jgi:alcohol dehydrogenase
MATAELKSATKLSASIPTMRALVYHTPGHGPGRYAWEDKPYPSVKEAGDAIVRITTTTICGTDLHILKGDLPTVTDGGILGLVDSSVPICLQHALCQVTQTAAGSSSVAPGRISDV